MGLFTIIAILMTLAALFAWLNHRFIRLPDTIGVMLVALVFSLILIGSGYLGFDIASDAEGILERIEFDEALLGGMLSFLLFAGALHIDLSELARQKWVIATLASVGLLISTFLVGYASFWIFGALGLEIPLIYCLLFGSLISPTDPIAVLSILKKIGAPKSLESKIAGESLFNDGVAVVIFLILLEIAQGGGEVGAAEIGRLFAVEAVGGAVFGFGIGFVTYWMLKTVDSYQVEVMLTLALVSGGYALASALHLSGPIAIVVAGLMIGNRGRMLAMSETTRRHLDTFWELVDEILNAILFALIGLEILILQLTSSLILAGLVMIPVVIVARFIAVGLPVTLMKKFRAFSPKVVQILTWGGLRGGISVALALALPAGYPREVILTVTYCVVIFSIAVQGLTIGSLVRSGMKADGGELEESPA